MVVMTEVLAKLVEGLAAGLPQAMADIYGMQRDGPVPEQLQLQSDFKMAELHRDHELRREQAVWESTIRVDEHIEMARAAAELDASPFGHQSDQAAYRHVQKITRHGTRPALLLAPFLNTAGAVQENLNNPFGYAQSLRSSWNDSAWATKRRLTSARSPSLWFVPTGTPGRSARSLRICQ
jgi:hypothetical protein